MNLFYRTLRVVARIGLQIYFKKVSVQGAEYLKSDRPMLIALNHPSSFLEACVMACWMEFPLHFIVRGDVFHPLFRWFFKWTYQIPIYRFRDGFSNLRNNSKTFELCHQKLSEGGKIIIFAEGSTKWTKKLRPLQKGTARIAKGTLEKYPNLPLQIVPVGINFEDIFKFRSSCIIKVGEAFKPAEYMNNGKDTARLITERLAQGMQDCVLHLDKTEDETVFNIMSDYKGFFNEPDESFAAQMQLAEYINKEMTDECKTAAKEIDAICKSKELVTLKPEVRSYRQSSIDLIIELLHYISATIVNGPALLGWWWGKRISNHSSFTIPIRLALSGLLYIFTLLLFLVLLIWGLGWLGILVFLLICIFIYLHIGWYDRHIRYQMAIKWKDLQENHRFCSYIEKLKKCISLS